MGCNCKNKYKGFEKLAYGGKSTDEKKKFNWFEKILKVLLQIGFGILSGAVIIIMIVPMLVYIIGCLILGKEAHFNIKNITKKQKK